MTASIWIAALSALFVWWFSTGAILLVVRRADRAGGRAHRAAVLAALPVLALGLAGAWSSVDDDTATGAYVGFLSALAIWGWIELTFLTGAITGPSRAACPPDATGGDRLLRAWNTVAHHEILLLLGLFALAVASSGHPNGTALSTYLILFAARISAKLNLYLGVPRINVEFVPASLNHLKRYFRKGPATPALPLAIVALSALLAYLVQRTASADTPFDTVGAALLATLAALALLEHWLMVLPLPDAKLWRWMLPVPAAPAGGYPAPPDDP